MCVCVCVCVYVCVCAHMRTWYEHVCGGTSGRHVRLCMCIFHVHHVHTGVLPTHTSVHRVYKVHKINLLKFLCSL